MKIESTGGDARSVDGEDVGPHQRTGVAHRFSPRANTEHRRGAYTESAQVKNTRTEQTHTCKGSLGDGSHRTGGASRHVRWTKIEDWETG